MKMESPLPFVLIEEFAFLTRQSVSNVRRLIAKRKKDGLGDTPLPVSPPKARCKFALADVERYLSSRDGVALQSDTTPPINVQSARQTKRQEREFRERRESEIAAARTILARHAAGRKPK
jgi:hypothetical protein